MLILTRRIGEKLILKEDDKPPITVVITDVKDTQVRLGIEADRSVVILREELLNEQ